MSNKELNDRMSLVFQGMLSGIVLTIVSLERLTSQVFGGLIFLILVVYVYFAISDHYEGEERRNLARFAGFALIASALSLFWMMVFASRWDWLVFVVCHALYILGLYLAYANDDGSTNYYVMVTLVITGVVIGLGIAFGIPYSSWLFLICLFSVEQVVIVCYNGLRSNYEK